jgi:hypothetical protein
MTLFVFRLFLPFWTTGERMRSKRGNDVCVGRLVWILSLVSLNNGKLGLL